MCRSSSLVSLAVIMLARQARAFDSSVPVMLINTSIELPPAIEKLKVPGTVKVWASGGDWNLPATRVLTNVDVRRKGESSDVVSLKKQYKLYLEESVGLLNLPANRVFSLHGPIQDKSMQRNALTFNVSNAAGGRASFTQYVNLMLIMDGVSVLAQKHYRGLYVLIEVIGADMFGFGEAEEAGAFIIAKDKANAGDEGFISETAHLTYTLAYPLSGNTSFQRERVGAYMGCVEERLFDLENFKDPILGYRALLDVESFVVYFLLTELSNNIDSYRYSTYLHKHASGKLQAGPLWDMNLAFGNVNQGDSSCVPWDEACEQEFKYAGKKADLTSYYNRLFDDPFFQSAVFAKWTELRADGGSLSDAALKMNILTRAASISQAKQRDEQLWPLTAYVDMEPQQYCCMADFEDHTQFLLDFVLGRAAWLDGQITEEKIPYFPKIHSPAPKPSCCSDPTFQACAAPNGDICALSDAEKEGGVGAYWDIDCGRNGKSKIGCVFDTDEGGCRTCRTPAWRQGGPGDGGMELCPICLPEYGCADIAFRTSNPSASSGSPTESPSAPQTPTKAPSAAAPTAAPQDDSQSNASTGQPSSWKLPVILACSLVGVLAAGGAVLRCKRLRLRKQHSSKHQVSRLEESHSVALEESHSTAYTRL